MATPPPDYSSAPIPQDIHEFEFNSDNANNLEHFQFEQKNETLGTITYRGKKYCVELQNMSLTTGKLHWVALSAFALIRNLFHPNVNILLKEAVFTKDGYTVQDTLENSVPQTHSYTPMQGLSRVRQQAAQKAHACMTSIFNEFKTSPPSMSGQSEEKAHAAGSAGNQATAAAAGTTGPTATASGAHRPQTTNPSDTGGGAGGGTPSTTTTRPPVATAATAAAAGTAGTVGLPPVDSRLTTANNATALPQGAAAAAAAAAATTPAGPHSRPNPQADHGALAGAVPTTTPSTTLAARAVPTRTETGAVNGSAGAPSGATLHIAARASQSPPSTGATSLAAAAAAAPASAAQAAAATPPPQANATASSRSLSNDHEETASFEEVEIEWAGGDANSSAPDQQSHNSSGAATGLPAAAAVKDNSSSGVSAPIVLPSDSTDAAKFTAATQNYTDKRREIQNALRTHLDEISTDSTNQARISAETVLRENLSEKKDFNSSIRKALTIARGAQYDTRRPPSAKAEAAIKSTLEKLFNSKYGPEFFSDAKPSQSTPSSQTTARAPTTATASTPAPAATLPRPANATAPSRPSSRSSNTQVSETTSSQSVHTVAQGITGRPIEPTERHSDSDSDLDSDDDQSSESRLSSAANAPTTQTSPTELAAAAATPRSSAAGAASAATVLRPATLAAAPAAAPNPAAAPIAATADTAARAATFNTWLLSIQQAFKNERIPENIQDAIIGVLRPIFINPAKMTFADAMKAAEKSVGNAGFFQNSQNKFNVKKGFNAISASLREYFFSDFGPWLSLTAKQRKDALDILKNPEIQQFLNIISPDQNNQARQSAVASLSYNLTMQQRPLQDRIDKACLNGDYNNAKREYQPTREEKALISQAFFNIFNSEHGSKFFANALPPESAPISTSAPKPTASAAAMTAAPKPAAASTAGGSASIAAASAAPTTSKPK